MTDYAVVKWRQDANGMTFPVKSGAVPRENAERLFAELAGRSDVHNPRILTAEPSEDTVEGFA